MDYLIHAGKGYYSNGNINYDRPLRSGQYHGIQRQWWDNGSRDFEIMMINGKYQGIFERWTYYDQRWIISSYKEGINYGTKILIRYA